MKDRIHRDVRFAMDKSPYKTFASAQFRHEIGRNVHAPGFYLHLEPGNVFFGGGIWRPDGAAVAAVRDAIVEEPARWRRLTSSKAQRETFELAGECLKRPPRGYDPEHSHIEDLKRKDFICVAHIEEGRVCGAGFVDEIATLCRQSAPFVRFLTDALDLEF